MKNVRLAVIGSRDFNSYYILERILNDYRKSFNVICIISGGARGADSLAEKYAHQYNIPFISHLAEWEIYGNRAGFIRNKNIIDDCDQVIAFWDGESKGTLHSINLAEKANKPVVVIRYTREISDLF